MSVGSEGDRKPSFLQDGLRLVSNSFLVTLVNLASGVVLARCMGPEGRGLLAAVMVYPTLFLQFAQLGLRQSAAYALGRRVYSDQQVVAAVSAVGLLMGGVGILVCAGALVAAGNPAFTPLIIGLTVAALPVSLYEYLSTGVLLGKKLVGQLAQIQRLAVLQRFALTVALVWWLGWDVPGALVATLLSAALVTGVALRRLSRIAPIQPRFHFPTIRFLLSKGVIYSVVLFVGVLMERMDIVLLERLSTLEEIGLYTTAFATCAFTALLPNALTPVLFSYSANAPDARAFGGRVAVLLRVTLVFSVAISGLLVVAAPLLIPLMYGAEFALAVDIVLFIAPATVSSIYSKVLIADLAGRGRPYIALQATVPALVILVICNLVLIPNYGALGAAAGSSLSQVFVAVLLTFLYARATGMKPASLLRYRRDDFRFLAVVAASVRRRFLPVPARQSSVAGKG